MPEKPKHTPLPWKIFTDSKGYLSLSPIDAFIDHGSANITDTDRANADFILRACNSHYELLEATRNLMAGVETVYHSDMGWEELRLLVQAAKAAIAKATS